MRQHMVAGEQQASSGVGEYDVAARMSGRIDGGQRAGSEVEFLTAGDPLVRLVVAKGSADRGAGPQRWMMAGPDAINAGDVDGPHVCEPVGDVACAGGPQDRQLRPERGEPARQKSVNGRLLTLA